MIETIVLDRNSLTFQRTHAVGEATRMREVASNILWVDVKDPTSQDFEDLAREFCLHPLAIEDCQHRHQRPKVDEYLGYYFIDLYEAELSADNRLELRELEIFLGKN